MQLAMLAPYNNLATSVAAALVPTLLSQNYKVTAESNDQTANINGDGTNKTGKYIIYLHKLLLLFYIHKLIFYNYKNIIYNFIERLASKNDNQFNSKTRSMRNSDIIEQDEPTSTVPEVYVRPPTPTPSAINLPIITVSCPSRRSSIISNRRDSDVSTGSRRSSACSVKFINDDGTTPTADNIQSSVLENLKKSERDITRRNSEMITPCSSNKDVRRCSDFSHEKNRGSQFATKLRRNSDFGNRTPKRMMPLDDNPRLSKVLDVSPSGKKYKCWIYYYFQCLFVLVIYIIHLLFRFTTKF